eukprot:15999-Heterococcus_DN1.PRE.1
MSGKGQSASKGTPGGSAGSSSSNNSSSSSYSVDAKLTFIVRQYAGEQRDKRQAATEQGAVDYLFGKHQEAISTRGLQKQCMGTITSCKVLELNYTTVSYCAHTANGTPVSSSRKRARGDSSSNANSSNGTAGASRDDPVVSDDEVQALAVEAANRAQVRLGKISSTLSKDNDR